MHRTQMQQFVLVFANNVRTTTNHRPLYGNNTLRLRVKMTTFADSQIQQGEIK